MNNDPRKTRPWRLALHEAAHVVLAQLAGLGVHRVRLLEGGGGSCVPHAARTHADLDRTLLAAVAGGAVEEVAFGSSLHFSPSDAAVAWRVCLLRTGGDRGRARALLERVKARARNLLSRPAVARAVKAVARELLERRELRGWEAWRVAKEALAPGVLTRRRGA